MENGIKDEKCEKNIMYKEPYTQLHIVFQIYVCICINCFTKKTRIFFLIAI